MHIKKIRIENIKAIKEFEMNFSNPAGWHVLIGDNGAGKSSILQMIALVLLGQKNSYSLRLDLNDFLRYNENRGFTAIEFFKTKGYERQFKMSESLFRKKDYNVKFGSLSVLSSHMGFRANGGFAASFGPFRRFTGGNPEWDKMYEAKLEAAAHMSVFSGGVALTESLKWLVNLNYEKLEKNEESALTLDYLKSFINDDGLLPHNTKFTRVSSKGVFLQDGNGQEIGITEMSDGFRSVLSMTLEIIRLMVRNFGVDKVFEHVKQGDIKIGIEGVILIDEVDAHLHPTWQTKIGQWFTKYFPNIQFIVTTHSPLICRACDNGSIWRLRGPKSEEQSGEITGIEKQKLIIGNILDAYGTELFGQSPVRSVESNGKLKRLGQLNILYALGKIKEEEETERRELQKILSTDDPTGF